MPQPEVCSSEGDADSQLAMSDTQSEPSSEDMSESAASVSPTSKPLKLRGPAPPPKNPLQFIKIKPPTNMYTAAPVQKPVVEIVRKEEPEDWQMDLDGWKANRRKRQEQLMERVSEFKKSDNDPSVGSRKSKTFSEMMRARKHNLVVYDDDNEINFSELGLAGQQQGNRSQEDPEEQEEDEEAEDFEEERQIRKYSAGTVGTNGRAEYKEEKIIEKSEAKIVEKEAEIPKVQEYTYEKAIQNYAEFANSRVSQHKTSEASSTPKILSSPPKIVSSPPKLASSPPKLASSPPKLQQYSPPPKIQSSPPKLPSSPPRVISSPPKVVSAPPLPTSAAPTTNNNNSFSMEMSSPKKNNNNKYVATAVREVKVVTETIVMSDSEEFLEAEEELEEVEEEEPAPRMEQAPKVAAPIIKSSIVKRISGTATASMLSKTEAFNNNNFEFIQSNHEPVITASLSSTSTTSLFQNITMKPITSKISQFERSIEESVLHNPAKKLRPPVPNKPPKSAPPPPPVSLPPPISPAKEMLMEEVVAHIPLSPSNSLGDVPDSVRPISDLTRALSPRDRSPMGGEDSGVHTADSVSSQLSPIYSQSDEVEDEDPTTPLPLSSGLLGMINAPIVDHELSALLAPLTKMEPPREKPPPPPPVGAVDDTETMRKCFLGLEITKAAPSVPPPIPPPQTTNEKKDEFLSNQLKEKLLKLEEEKNNVINLEKKVHAERLPQIVQDYNLSAQERLVAEREALRLEREILQQAKKKQLLQQEQQQQQIQLQQQEGMSFAKKLAMRSLESLDIQPEVEGRETPPDAYHTPKNSPLSGSPLKVRQQQRQQSDYANYPEQQHLRKAQSEEQVQKQERTYVNQAFFQPPQPRYSSIYEDPYNYDKQEPVVFRNKKQGPPPPIKPTARHSTSAVLQRNYSADSILESIDGDMGPTVPQHEPINHRASMPLSCSMSQLPNKQPPPPSQQPQLKSQRPRSSGGLGLANYHQHWLVQEAEHRRIQEQQQRQAKQQQQPKHLPDAIIMSLTQRVQQRQSSQLPQRMSPQRSPPQRTQAAPQPAPATDDKVLSVSGKKKCSHCNSELGRGAAMIIESLRLFYHIDCFKCCVCCIQLGDGLMGTDVRVRNGKLHCHSCYSSDDGVKFSCV